MGNFYSAMNVNFTHIEISSDKNFDASHPAGSLLSDIIEIITVSPYKYIKSNYRSMYYISSDDKTKYPYNLFYPSNMVYHYGENMDYTNHFPWHLIQKKISDLTNNDLSIIGQPYIRDRKLLFPRSPILAVLQLPEPEEKGKHTISITFITDDAVPKLYRTTVEVDFE